MDTRLLRPAASCPSKRLCFHCNLGHVPSCKWRSNCPCDQHLIGEHSHVCTSTREPSLCCRPHFQNQVKAFASATLLFFEHEAAVVVFLVSADSCFWTVSHWLQGIRGVLHIWLCLDRPQPESTLSQTGWVRGGGGGCGLVWKKQEEEKLGR